jgi:CubicO group peptidase (beta-lactamase class C family)
MSAGMQRLRIAGGAYVLVVQGRIVASRGFGVADTSTLRRIHPDSTTFGLASTTKLLTAIAAARLAHDGVFGIDADIEPYFTQTPMADRVRGATLSRLLTHTAGYDDPTIGSAARTPKDVIPLDRYLDRALTKPWIAPRTVTAYSNAGVALAGRTLELASGMAYPLLIDSAVFIPFGMTRSSVSQPLPPELEAARAIPRNAPRIWFNDAPASAAYSTPQDMGRLMSHLLLPQSSADTALANMLFSRRFTNHPALPGVTLGFAETTDGPGTFEHGGDWQDYSSGMYLDRANGIGLFAVFSDGDGGAIARDLWRTLRDAYAGPKPAYATPPSRMITAECQEHFGTYRDTRMSRHTLGRLGILTGDVRQMVVRINTGVAEIDKRVYREMGGGVVRSDDGRLVAFRCGRGLADTYAFRADQPLTSYVRLTRFETRLAQRLYLCGALIATIVALVFDVKRGPRRGKNADGTPARSDALDFIARIARVLAALVILGVALTLGYMLASADPWSFQYGLPARVVQVLGVIRYALIGVAVALVVSLVALIRAKSASGIVQVLLVIPVVVLAGLLYQWSS